MKRLIGLLISLLLLGAIPVASAVTCENQIQSDGHAIQVCTNDDGSPHSTLDGDIRTTYNEDGTSQAFTNNGDVQTQYDVDGNPTSYYNYVDGSSGTYDEDGTVTNMNRDGEVTSVVDSEGNEVDPAPAASDDDDDNAPTEDPPAEEPAADDDDAPAPEDQEELSDEERAENYADDACSNLSGSEYSECHDRNVDNYLEAESEAAADEILGDIDAEDVEVGVIGDDDDDDDDGDTNNDQENDPNIIQLGVGGTSDEQSLNVNDPNVFNVGSILTTSGQNTDQFLGEDQPILAFLLSIINFISLTIGSIAILLIIIGGLLMIVSEGDENRLQRGKDIVIAAIIGLVISLSAYLIVTFFQSIFY
jgi:hypothetical protein